MKKIFLFSFFLLLQGFAFGQISEKADVSMNGAFFSPTTINGCGGTLSMQFGNATANTQIPVGGITVYLTGPVGSTRAYTFQSVQPTGPTGMSWTFDANSNAWTGTNTIAIQGGQTLQYDFKVDGTTVTTTPASTDVGVTPNVSWTQHADNSQNNIVSPTATVSAVCTNNVIAITPTSSNVTQGSTVVLTASGCTGGTYTWSPTGGTVGGVANSNYTIVAPQGTTTYTVTCSTGGTATATVTGSPQTCAANAGVLN